MTPTPDTLLDGTHTVLTPEYVEFRFTLAGVYSRFLAWLLDALIVGFATMAVLVVFQVAMAAFPGFASALGIVVYFLVDWGYGITLETVWAGQTVGKRVMSLRVIQESGVRIGFYHAALRNLARVVDRLPLLYLVGGSVALVSRSHQRLGDLLAGTIVVRERRLKVPSAIETRGEEGLLADPLFVSRVKRLSTEERELVLSAALRREELRLEARLTLFSALGARLQDSLAMEKPAHLSDEKWTLLVAAALLPAPGQRPGRSSNGPRSTSRSPPSPSATSAYPR
ncbi:RDD family protein [Corallococcus sp. AB049A]|uniref:RDD family protein n=1 Tax=Corallococcus interemptor TaxID=2316720 RepID=A0A3A8Q1F9_9BACT|nr:MULTISPECIES: RDD family protein [Corallococcus]RKH38054.1 RDD family protein [Corallococcus sp. AB050B]RKH60810.1 RDD family protein [Corallococcus interemptor]RKI45602.1 RDD family protein [Corallococcus sp. AB049A]